MKPKNIKSNIAGPAKILLILSLSISLSCNFEFGGNPIGDDDDDTACQAEVVERVSIASNGAQANGNSESPSISSDGRFIAFLSEASNLVTNDSNGANDIFVHDRDTGATERVSVASDGTEADDASFSSSLSSDGNFVVFGSLATNLVINDTNGVADFFVHDRDNDATERIAGPSVFDIGSGIVNAAPAISPDGIFVGFRSPDDDLVAGDTNNSVDTFLINRDTDLVQRLSLSSSQIQGNSNSGNPSISEDNQLVVFPSQATNLVSNDTNGVEDVFVRNRDSRQTRRISLTFDCVEGDLASFSAVISADGEFVAIASLAENLVDNDSNGFSDIFVIPNPLSP